MRIASQTEYLERGKEAEGEVERELADVRRIGQQRADDVELRSLLKRCGEGLLLTPDGNKKRNGAHPHCRRELTLSKSAIGE